MPLHFAKELRIALYVLLLALQPADTFSSGPLFGALGGTATQLTSWRQCFSFAALIPAWLLPAAFMSGIYNLPDTFDHIGTLKVPGCSPPEAWCAFDAALPREETPDRLPDAKTLAPLFARKHDDNPVQTPMANVLFVWFANFFVGNLFASNFTHHQAADFDMASTYGATLAQQEWLRDNTAPGAIRMNKQGLT